jgi:ADP-ribose pyrophosphatase
MRVGAGGGDDSEDIVVHEVPLGDAPRWLMAQSHAGLEGDLKAWAGLWLATH